MSGDEAGLTAALAEQNWQLQALLAELLKKNELLRQRLASAQRSGFDTELDEVLLWTR
jgi:hypothetical protein